MDLKEKRKMFLLLLMFRLEGGHKEFGSFDEEREILFDVCI